MEAVERSSIDKSLITDTVQEHELRPLENIRFERVREKDCDMICKQAEELVGEVVKLNAALRAQAVETRARMQQTIKDLGFELREKASEHQSQNAAVRGFVSVFMPNTAGRYAEMLADHPEIHEETLDSVVKRRVSQLRLFFASLGAQDVNLVVLRQKLDKIWPSFNIKELKIQVENLWDLTGDADLEPAGFVSFDAKALRACLEGQAADTIQEELIKVAGFIEMAVGVLAKAFRFAREAKGKLSTLKELSARALAQVEARDKDEARQMQEKRRRDDEAVEARRKNLLSNVTDLIATKDTHNNYSDYKFMLTKTELEERMEINEERARQVFESLQVLCSNAMVVLEVIHEACRQGKADLEGALNSSGCGVLSFLGPQSLSCGAAPAVDSSLEEVEPRTHPFPEGEVALFKED